MNGRDPPPGDVVVAAALTGVGLVEARVTGTLVGDVVVADPDGVPAPEGDVGYRRLGAGGVGASPRAPSIPQDTVTGTVTPLPGEPGVPIGVVVEPAPVQVALELP